VNRNGEVMLPGWQAFDTHNNSFLAYRPIGKMPRQPLKRPLDGHNLDAGAGHLLAQLRHQKGSGLNYLKIFKNGYHKLRVSWKHIKEEDYLFVMKLRTETNSMELSPS